ncbi:MAG TPA: YbdK family carboxylate-amine ligase [Planctomycetaceae bacterium]|nr:YbdK family carboxylate-amine ligase [Planctomycetaceae bacterium]
MNRHTKRTQSEQPMVHDGGTRDEPLHREDDMSVRQGDKGPAAYKAEEMLFRPSPATTVGAELELMVLDPHSGDLAPGAVRLLKTCAEESIENVSAELMQSMIELKTGVCGNVADVRDQLVPRLRRVRNIARSMGYELAMSATHPFHRASNSAVSPSERYDRLVDRLAYLIHQRVVFGLHIHVGLPSGDMALGVMNQLVQYLPHLLALSANSPFWQGIDTGLASCRTALYRTLPHAGVPRYFPRWKDFRAYFRVMRECGAIQSMKDIYWDIRPRPEFGTIELRVCDMPATLATTFALVALVRSLAIASQRLLEERPQMRRGDIRKHWIAVENKWLATRYGLGGMYIRTPAGKRRPLRQDLNELLARLMPVARESGDDVFLAKLLPLDKFEAGADRQRRLCRESGNPRTVIDDMVASLSSELDSAVAPDKSPTPAVASSATSGVGAGSSQPPSPDPRGEGGREGCLSKPSPIGMGEGKEAGANGAGAKGTGSKEKETVGNVTQADPTVGSATQADPALRSPSEPAATPRASAPPAAGAANPFAAVDLPASFLFRPAARLAEPIPLAVGG